MPELSYAVVIATKNRIDALAVSIPLALAQSRPPSQIVVVDKSDDHAAVRALCESLRQRAPMPITVLEADQANAARQRNLGLELVSEDIVMFPDDDSFWYPTTAEQIMRVYEDDVEERIGGISAIQTDTSPVATEDSIGIADARLTDVPWISRARRTLEARLVPQPLFSYGVRRTRELASKSASAAGLTLIETLTGFRMSFRTAIAKELRFDEVLGSRIGYALGEDRDLSARVLGAGLLLAAAPGALVFHNVYPAKRANGFSYGYFQIFNYLYICRSVLPRDAGFRGRTHRYLRYKTALYRLGSRRDQYAREVCRGARAALAEFSFVMDAPDGTLQAAYGAACERNLPLQAGAAAPLPA